MSEGKFATAINCMDGRTQLPVIEYLKNKYHVNHVDTITEPGPNKILAENRDRAALDSIKRRVEISVKKHGSRHIAIVGHHDCAGNPTDNDTQVSHLLSAIITVKSWNFGAEIIGLWLDDKWKVNEVNI